MDVLGHDHVADYHETVTPSHRLQNLQEQISVLRGAQERAPLITTGSDEVQVSGAVITMQPIRHERFLA